MSSKKAQSTHWANVGLGQIGRSGCAGQCASSMAKEHCSLCTWAEGNSVSHVLQVPAICTWGLRSVARAGAPAWASRGRGSCSECAHQACGQKVFKAPALRLHVNNNKFYWVSGGFISNQHKMLQKHLRFLQMFMSSFVTIAFSWTKIKTAKGCKTILMEFFKRFLWPASCCWRFLVGCW